MLIDDLTFLFFYVLTRWRGEEAGIEDVSSNVAWVLFVFSFLFELDQPLYETSLCLLSVPTGIGNPMSQTLRALL